MKNLFFGFIAILIASGCSTFNKQKSKAEQFYQRYPNELARVCADAFPVKEKLIPGKETVKHDTTLVAGPEIKCPPAADGKQTTLHCPPTKNITHYVYRTDTLIKENTARVDQYRQDLLTCGNTTEGLENQVNDLKTAERSKLYWIVGLVAAMAGSIVLRFVKLKLPF